VGCVEARTGCPAGGAVGVVPSGGAGRNGLTGTIGSPRMP